MGIKACADVDRPDIVGSTPLLVAAKNGHLSMARWLLEARADLNLGQCLDLLYLGMFPSSVPDNV